MVVKAAISWRHILTCRSFKRVVRAAISWRHILYVFWASTSNSICSEICKVCPVGGNYGYAKTICIWQYVGIWQLRALVSNVGVSLYSLYPDFAEFLVREHLHRRVYHPRQRSTRDVSMLESCGPTLLARLTPRSGLPTTLSCA